MAKAKKTEIMIEVANLDLLEEKAESNEDTEKIESVLRAIIDADSSKIFTEGTTEIKPPSMWDETERAAVTRVSETTAGLQVQFADKNRASDLLARVTGVYKQESQVNENPLYKLLAEISRDDLKVIVEALGRLKG